MNRDILGLIDKLACEHSLDRHEYYRLITELGPREAEYLTAKAREVREGIYGKDVYIRGLIEISNFCKNDCYYCGIRRGNRNCQRYRLTAEDILACCEEGYNLGFRTFVMQGGEDRLFTDEHLTGIISEIKRRWPDVAVTLSLGERSKESYSRLKESGADRYLLRHETANEEHYSKLHPGELKWSVRMQCLEWLKELGYQVGCGFMVGSPYQTDEMLADELKFIEEFKPDMCGIGPFIPHRDTVFKDEPAGSVEMTLRLLSCIRLIHPRILLPATTALGSLTQDGRERGILAGANVVMPNLSPTAVRKKYMLYDNKLSDGAESAQAKASLEARMASIGYKVVEAKGDVKK